MEERCWEINGNLDDARNGLSNYRLFETAICKVKALFDISFGLELLNKVNFYVDNATADSGYTPILTVVLKKIAVIKLSTHPQDTECNIAYQFAHELMHIVFMAVFGIDKARANETEESICSAAALIIIQNLYPEEYDIYNRDVKELDGNGYRKGIEVAEKAGFSLVNLMPLVNAITY